MVKLQAPQIAYHWQLAYFNCITNHSTFENPVEIYWVQGTKNNGGKKIKERKKEKKKKTNSIIQTLYLE